MLKASCEMGKQKSEAAQHFVTSQEFCLHSSPHHFAESTSSKAEGLSTQLHTGPSALRNFLQFARTAQTQINVCKWCSAWIDFLSTLSSTVGFHQVTRSKENKINWRPPLSTLGIAGILMPLRDVKLPRPSCVCCVPA